jgi:GT2 family glycosyltransferase
VHYIFNNKNIGYGAAHNIAIRESTYDDVALHLVINPDIILGPDTLETLVSFILEHPEIGCVSPKVIYPNGELQYLCKLLPTPLDVFGRRFLPKRWMKKRNQRYELRASGYNRIMNIPYLSGCFMLLRTEAVRKARLFDEQFFMYPEDVDLTRRIHRDYLTVFYPHTTIIHNHEKASYRSIRMLWVHMANMCKYFNKWGWWKDEERKLVNELTTKEYLGD